jgi:hypothetical protein
MPITEEHAMIRHRRTIAAVMAAAGLAMFGGAATAQAQTKDELFTEALIQLGIPMGPDDEAPAIGKRVCEMLTGGLTGNPNPVPVVRGVVTTLSSKGISREQAVGLTRVSVAAYCPQYARLIGR